MNPLTRLRHRHQLRNWLDMMRAANTAKRDTRRSLKSGWNQKVFMGYDSGQEGETPCTVAAFRNPDGCIEITTDDLKEYDTTIEVAL